MDAESNEKCEGNAVDDKDDSTKNSTSVSSGNCQNSKLTVINEHRIDDSEIKMLTNNVESSLSLNHNVNIIPNGLDHNCYDEIEYVSYKSELQMPDIMRLIQKDLSEPYSIYTYRYFIHNWPKLCFLAVHNGEYVGAVVCKLDIHRKIIRRGYIAMLAVDRKYRKRKIGSNLVLKAIRAMSADDADEDCERKLGFGQLLIGVKWELMDQDPFWHLMIDYPHSLPMYLPDFAYRRLHSGAYKPEAFPCVFLKCTDKVRGKNLFPIIAYLSAICLPTEVVLETEITNRPALKLYENLGFVRDKRLFRYYLNGVDALRLKLWLR